MSMNNKDFDFDFNNDPDDKYDDFDENYDFANGAPFGTFDLDGDGELDFSESAFKLDHYESMWDDEDDNFSDDGCDSFLDDFTDDGFGDDE